MLFDSVGAYHKTTQRKTNIVIKEGEEHAIYEYTDMGSGKKRCCY